MDFAQLQAQALSSGQDEEAVTVNTRALIDKVLARYSGEWTTLRELIQNAADASATTVKIKFETLPSSSIPAPPATSSRSENLKHVLTNHTLKTLLVTNNGDVFNTNDWNRLKRIAEGNPDETKIGAFGVGFYSVFADCEEPFVQSGHEAMAFYWKTNSLFTRRIQLPADSSGERMNTNFVLNYRNTTSAVPNLLSIAQFLATSLTFVALENMELWLDDFKVLMLQKKTAPSVDIQIPRDVETKTKEGLMRVQSLSRESIQMDATFMSVIGFKPSLSSRIGTISELTHGSEAPSLRSFFSRLANTSSSSSLKGAAAKEEKALQDMVLEDLTAPTTTNVFLQVITASIGTKVTAQFAAELERATKKPPPKRTKMAILTSTFDEAQASGTISKEAKLAKSVDIFSSVLPSGKQKGRVFIGFPTSQTTGAGFHISAPSVIPTVERESIDLNARWVKTWNIELLRIAGIMSRITYTSQMQMLSDKILHATETAGRKGKITSAEINKFIPEAMHIMGTFTFGDSTPSAQVVQHVESAFWTTNKNGWIDVYSTRGVLPTTSVRIATHDFSGFVEGIPVVPDELVDSDFMKKIRDWSLITQITIADVKKELGTKALIRSQVVAFISWIGKEAIKGAIDAPTIHDLLDTAVASLDDDKEKGGIIALGTIKYYRNPNKIPPELPASPVTIPHDLTRLSSANELQALGWEPLEIVPWTRFLVESRGGRNGLSPDHDITWSPKFSAQVLAIISKQWDSFSPSSKTTIVELLKPLTIIPTKYGMKVPSEAYFASVKLFDDLPTVQGCPGVKEKMLGTLGVRKTVELDKIFDRLLNPSIIVKDGEITTPKWSHVDLITYLASVRADIPKEDIEKLRSTPICAAEAGPSGQEASRGTERRYRISELFEPKDPLRALCLPTLQWPGKLGYRAHSQEGQFLSFLGLRSAPSVPELAAMMASPDVPTRTRAMTYFIANHHINSYASFDLGSSSKAILPIEGDEKRLVAPSQCFTNEKSALLGFQVLRRDLVLHSNKFGVSADPPMTECMNRLIASPPKTRRDAIALFGYFASRLQEISPSHVARLGDACIVPVYAKSGSTVKQDATNMKLIAPRMTFIGQSLAFESIFDFVDFSSDANAFLLHVGAKHEPSRLQLAALMSSEPARILGITQSPDKYLELLRLLAHALPDLKKDKVLFRQLQTSPFLIAIRHVGIQKDDKNVLDDADEEDEEANLQQLVLQPASKIVIVDDSISYEQFKTSVLVAPMEDTLEALYQALGSPSISSLIQDDTRLGSPLMDANGFLAKMQKRILERSKIFLNEYRAEHIKHNAKWLEKNLSLQMVSSINVRRSLRGYSTFHTSKQTASLKHAISKGWILHVTPDIDMWHVAQTLLALLLNRPTTQARTMFEYILNAELRELKRRGYNVDRILRSNAAEARIAEAERQRQLEAEQQQIKEQEAAWKQNQSLMSASAREDQNKAVTMPGAFDVDAPENSPPAAQKKPRGFLQNLRRGLGLDHDIPPQLEDFLGGSGRQSEDPPPYRDNDQMMVGSSTQQVARGPGKQTEAASSPAAIHQNLLNAVKSSRAHDSQALFSPPQTNEIKETSGYCDTQHAHDLYFVGNAKNGVRLFSARDVSENIDAFIAANVVGINAFSNLLVEVADIYAVPRSAIHIFYDEAGPTIAFNKQGAIFSNLRFFLQLHAPGMGTISGRVEATSYWWVVVSHELAHNLVSNHSADHSFYTESFVQQYFGKMMAKAMSYGQVLPENRLVEGVTQKLLE